MTPKKEVEIEATTYIKLAYAENSKAFKEALDGFRKTCVRNGTVQDMLDHVCHNFIHFGYDNMIEGVGYIKASWQKWKDIPEPHSGIELVSDHWPTFDYEHQIAR